MSPLHPLPINLQSAAGELCPLSLSNRGIIARLKSGTLCCLPRGEDVLNGDAGSPKDVPASHQKVGVKVVADSKEDGRATPEDVHDLGIHPIVDSLVAEEQHDLSLKTVSSSDLCKWVGGWKAQSEE